MSRTIPLKPFFETQACRSRRHCGPCRAQTPKGENFRAAIERKRGHSMAECPHGVTMGYVPPAPVPAARPKSNKQQRFKRRRQYIPGPGALVKLVLDRLGYRARFTCTCARMQQDMDAWGWIGCMKRGPAIVAAFIYQARQIGVEVPHDNLWGLLWGGMVNVAHRDAGVAGGGLG